MEGCSNPPLIVKLLSGWSSSVLSILSQRRAAWSLAGLIIRRSWVRIPPLQLHVLSKTKKCFRYLQCLLDFFRCKRASFFPLTNQADAHSKKQGFLPKDFDRFWRLQQTARKFIFRSRKNQIYASSTFCHIQQPHTFFIYMVRANRRVASWKKLLFAKVRAVFVMKTYARKKRLLCSRIGEFHPSSQQFYFTNALHFLYLKDTKCKDIHAKEE